MLREVEDQIVQIGTSGVGRCLELTNLGTDLRADLFRSRKLRSLKIFGVVTCTWFDGHFHLMFWAL